MIRLPALAIAALVAFTFGAKANQPQAATACKLTKRVVIVNLDNRKDTETLHHAWQAIRDGEPMRLHIAREEADKHRAASLRGIPSWGQLTAAQHQKIDPDHPNAPHDRDEYPPAMSDEGGKGANVRYILSSDNRHAGQLMGNELTPYCDTQAFRFEKRHR